ncbi:arabinofuranosidase catalytic domain-containing protein [Actinospica robiniae]|uniref:arabinofuranosidase catalytic domain-containing protein n=1 Tax=Actinospica robiniae TaxID=304901 RepID=UPI0003FFED34
MVISSKQVNQWCCFDYGSGETSNTDTGNATMNAIYWGTACRFGSCVLLGTWTSNDSSPAALTLGGATCS